ncbi:hypothetical protein HN51_054098 [Arachis hypogaea]|uniref:Uncharacterized protein n=1 Tax=Arachis hypogaea TaxID=3818 RepID=A0A6B9V514_ARAHY|nr:uncharacterized protein DS421_19g644970 [Arachis hypogaea]
MASKYAIVTLGLLALVVIVPSKIVARDFSETFSGYKAAYTEEKSKLNIGLNRLEGHGYMEGVGESLKWCTLCCPMSPESCRKCCFPKPPPPPPPVDY